ncbi:MAG: hypothetical protein KJ645_00930 [Planctomycetes bacterium]|nr:hypothetical protein [Planctomycetota bacterium]
MESVFLSVTTAPFNFDGESYVLVTLEDIGEILALRNIIPICAKCKNIRDDHDYWQSVELYFKEHLPIEFSHGLCHRCVHDLYPTGGAGAALKVKIGNSNEREAESG